MTATPVTGMLLGLLTTTVITETPFALMLVGAKDFVTVNGVRTVTSSFVVDAAT